ncbi:unnamed protein product [Hermetia illucens]|uniref:Uncharacterized protein n=1 Tax=Hermetia illucens TaxID=343691 RepID=A0A7R8UP43_HERIL|nr:unnamed protein product [Hermetia illucens]
MCLAELAHMLEIDGYDTIDSFYGNQSMLQRNVGAGYEDVISPYIYYSSVYCMSFYILGFNPSMELSRVYVIKIDAGCNKEQYMELSIDEEPGLHKKMNDIEIEKPLIIL